MPFSPEQVEQLYEGREEVLQKKAHIFDRFIRHEFQSKDATEFVWHGFLRRIKILVNAIDLIFEEIPPEIAVSPEERNLASATIALQAFVFNVFGSIDNLAWIWVTERNIRRANGKSLSSSVVGLNRKCEVVRSSFSEDFVRELEAYDRWFQHIESFRHALAHRIPLYIPPFMVSEQNLNRYNEIEDEMKFALRQFDSQRYEELYSEQKRLGPFDPVMVHSFSERSDTVIFHPQIIADFNTLDRLANGILDELERPQFQR